MEKEELKTITCTKCGEEFEATEGSFHKQKLGKFGLRPICKVCNNKRSQEYRKNNKEKCEAATKKWKKDNKEKLAIYEAEYRKNNKEKFAEYYLNNKEKCAATMKKWHDNNREKIAIRTAKWKKDNPDKVNAYEARRRAQELNQPPVNADKLKMELYHTICAYLNKPCKKPMWHVDHIQPLSKGGLDHEDNLQILTAKLNLEKGAKWPLTVEEEIKFKGIKL